VIFVEDYLQLSFDDARLTVYVWPAVTIGATSWTIADTGYRDALCSLIGQHVHATADAPDVGIVIDLGSASIRVDPTPADLSGPEIAYLSVEDRMSQTAAVQVWRPGEAVFAARDWSR
jgi:hypothetical protein